MKIRCSQLGKIMTNPTKAEANAVKDGITTVEAIKSQYKLSEEQLKKQIKL